MPAQGKWSRVKYAQNNAVRAGASRSGGANLFWLVERTTPKRIHGTTRQQVGRLFER